MNPIFQRFFSLITGSGPKPSLGQAVRNACLPPGEATAVLHGMHTSRAPSLNILEGSQMRVLRESGNVIYVQGNISRNDLKANPNIMFAFGDNVADQHLRFDKRLGIGGQAAEMAGERNSAGIPTLWNAAGQEDSYFSYHPEQITLAKQQIYQAIKRIPPRAKVVVPVDSQGNINIGTGRAQLSQHAPELLKYIRSELQKLESPQSTTAIQNQNVPIAETSNSHIDIGNHFVIRVRLPEGIQLSQNAKVMLKSPIFGDIDITSTGLVKPLKISQTIGHNSKTPSASVIQIESKKPMPAHFLGVTTEFNFLVDIVDQGNVVARTNIEIGSSRLPLDQQDFIKDITQ